MRHLVVSALLAVAVAASAQDLSSFEKILFTFAPSATIYGASDSSFYAINTIFAGGDVQLYPACPGGQIDTLRAGETVQAFACSGTARLGRVLFVKPGSAVWFQSTIVSKAADVYAYASMPVVRESGLFEGKSAIPGVGSTYTYTDPPSGPGACRIATPRFRHALRIYDPDGSGAGAVRVRRWDEQLGPSLTPISEDIVELSRRDGDGPSHPAWGELPLPEICHPFSCHTPCMGGSQRIEIEPLTPGLRYYPLVSATDNVNQQILIHVPQ